MSAIAGRPLPVADARQGLRPRSRTPRVRVGFALAHAATFLGLNIGAVVLIHEGSTLIVVANALRLLNFERGKEHAGIDHEDKPEH